MITRSLLFSTLLLSFSTVGSVSATEQPMPEESPGITQQGADSYAFKIGDVRVTALSDGTVPQDLHKILQEITNEKIDARLAHAYQSNPVETSIDAFLLEMGERLVLVDTGAGDLFGQHSQFVLHGKSATSTLLQLSIWQDLIVGDLAVLPSSFVTQVLA